MNYTEEHMSGLIFRLRLTKAEDLKVVGDKGIVQRRYG